MSAKYEINSDILKYDALSEAEKLTGQSYKDDETTSRLGLLLAMDHNAKKEEMLKAADDTGLCNEIDNYTRIITEEGFELVLSVPFKGDDGTNETFFVYWHSDGILLKFDTYQGQTVNGGEFLYNWIPSDIGKIYAFTSSGGFTEHNSEMIWAGYHDCREALRHNIKQLRDNGEFLSTWIEQPFLWLLHHGDTKNVGYDHEKIAAERVALLPEHVQDAIRGKAE